MVVFDGDQHIGQLQFRPYVPNTISPEGLYNPLYWMDFGEHAPALPQRTLAIFCYHVGQLDNTENRDASYFGQGISLELLNRTLKWAFSNGFESVVAKGCSDYRQVIESMGGLPTSVYEKWGFRVVKRYVDQELRSTIERIAGDQTKSDPEQSLEEMNLDLSAEIGICVKDSG